MKKKISLVVLVVCMLIGFTILIGTAGASDLDRISFDEIVKRCLVGIMFLVMGCLSLKIGGLENEV